MSPTVVTAGRVVTTSSSMVGGTISGVPGNKPVVTTSLAPVSSVALAQVGISHRTMTMPWFFHTY
jgi:hypothetical protein